MVNKGRIHKEITKFMMISSKLIKSDNELMIEMGKMIIYERELQIVFTESEIIENDLDFTKKLKIEVGRNFQTCKS